MGLISRLSVRSEHHVIRRASRGRILTCPVPFDFTNLKDEPTRERLRGLILQHVNCWFTCTNHDVCRHVGIVLRYSGCTWQSVPLDHSSAVEDSCCNNQELSARNSAELFFVLILFYNYSTLVIMCFLSCRDRDWSHWTLAVVWLDWWEINKDSKIEYSVEKYGCNVIFRIYLFFIRIWIERTHFLNCLTSETSQALFF